MGEAWAVHARAADAVWAMRVTAPSHERPFFVPAVRRVSAEVMSSGLCRMFSAEITRLNGSPVIAARDGDTARARRARQIARRIGQSKWSESRVTKLNVTAEVGAVRERPVARALQELPFS